MAVNDPPIQENTTGLLGKFPQVWIKWFTSIATTLYTLVVGNDGDVIYNNGGVFGSEAAFNWDKIDKILTVDGDISATGFITGKKVGIFAFLAAPAVTTITTAGTYVPIAGIFNNDPIEGFSAATTYTPGIKYTESKTTHFEVDWHAALEANLNNTEVKVTTAVNGMVCPDGIMTQFCKNLNQPYNMSGTCLHELSEGDELQLIVTSNGSGDQITFDNFTTTISEFFD